MSNTEAKVILLKLPPSGIMLLSNVPPLSALEIILATKESVFQTPLPGAFYNCSNLNFGESWGWTSFYHITEIKAKTFYNCAKLVSKNNKGILALHNSIVTSIGEQAFYGCTSISTVSTGSTINSIGANAFANCPNLTSVSFYKADTVIGENAFVNAAITTSLQSAYTAGGSGVYARTDTTSTTWTKS